MVFGKFTLHLHRKIDLGLDLYKHGEDAYPSSSYGHGWNEPQAINTEAEPLIRNRNIWMLCCVIFKKIVFLEQHHCLRQICSISPFDPIYQCYFCVWILDDLSLPLKSFLMTSFLTPLDFMDLFKSKVRVVFWRPNERIGGERHEL